MIKGAGRSVILSFSVPLQIWVLLSLTLCVVGETPVDGPTVNKCCPLHQRYDNGDCVATDEIGQAEDIFWEAHQTHVMLDDGDNSDSRNVSEQSVLFK